MKCTYRLAVSATGKTSAEAVVAASTLHFGLSLIVSTGCAAKSINVGTSLTVGPVI